MKWTTILTTPPSPCTFSGRFKKYNDISVFKLNASEVVLNYDTFSMQCKMGKEVNQKERVKLQQPKPLRKDYNQWKWADAVIDTEKFGAVLKDVANKLKIRL